MLRSVTLLALVGAAASQTLHGSGTTNPSKFFWNIMDKFQCRAKMDVSMSYRAVGSSTVRHRPSHRPSHLACPTDEPSLNHSHPSCRPSRNLV